jgi:hypothetical protein
MRDDLTKFKEIVKEVNTIIFGKKIIHKIDLESMGWVDLKKYGMKHGMSFIDTCVDRNSLIRKIKEL